MNKKRKGLILLCDYNCIYIKAKYDLVTAPLGECSHRSGQSATETSQNTGLLSAGGH